MWISSEIGLVLPFTVVVCLAPSPVTYWISQSLSLGFRIVRLSEKYSQAFPYSFTSGSHSRSGTL